MAFKKGLTEGGREEDDVSCVGECTIVLECCCGECIEKAVDGQRAYQQNGESISRACYEDYPLGY